MNGYWKFAVFISVLSIGTLVGQEKIMLEKRMYQSPEGKLFIQKSLPIYLRIATSPEENAETVLMQSDDSKDYVNPMYFDTEGFNTFRSPSKVDQKTKQIVYPMEDIIFEVYADSRSPVTQAKFGNLKPYISDSITNISGKARVSLIARDQLSGVKHIYYSVNGAPYEIYSDTLLFEEEKLYTLKYYSIDNVGNDENIKVLYLKIDDSAPVSEIKVDVDLFESIVSERSKIAIINNDPGVGTMTTYYTLDSQKETIYKYPINARYLSQGEHKITYYSIDKVGNKENLKEFKFYVDKTPPSLVEEVVGKTFVANGQEFTSGRSRLKLTAFDNKAGVKEIYYSVAGEEYQLYDRPFYLKLRSGGDIQIKTYAVDNVNNKIENIEETSRISVPYIDLSGPTLANVFLGPTYISRDTLYLSGKTKISLSGRDAEAGLKKIEYVVDNEGFKDYDEPFTVTQEGYHSIIYTGYDFVDNTNKHNLEFMVDTTGPEIYHRFSIKPIDTRKTENDLINVYPAHVVLFLSSTDEHVGYDKLFYSVNGGAEKLYTGMIKDFKSNIEYTINISARDKLKNATEDKIHFFIE